MHNNIDQDFIKAVIESSRLIGGHMVLLNQTTEPIIRYANTFKTSLNVY